MTGRGSRTIDELFSRYELEPTISDIYVEGPFDEEVLSRCLQKAGRTETVVYPIGTVEVPNELLKAHGLTEGNKQRVIALARQLSNISNDCSYRCIVDKDLDDWLGGMEITPRLVWTKYCSIELYFFMEELIHDVLIVAAKSRINDYQLVLLSIVCTLRDLFAVRLADRDLGWSMSWLSPDKHLRVQNSLVQFDQTDYVRRLLMKNRRLAQRPAFEASRTKWLAMLTGDPRSYIRGHDFVELLAWTVRAFHGVKEFSSTETIERIFVLKASEVSELLELLQ